MTSAFLATMLAVGIAQAGADTPSFWRLDGAPPLVQEMSTPHPLVLLPETHGPDTNSGADVPAGGFKYKKKKKPVLSYIGGSLTAAGLLYLANSRTLGFEAEDASTPEEASDLRTQQSNRKTLGFVLLGTGGTCIILDFFI